MTQAPLNEKRMPFVNHLDELRARLVRSLYVFVAGFGVSWFWLNSYVLELLRAPLFNVVPEPQRKLYFTSLFENFFTHLKVAAVTSLFLGAPYFLYQLWAFVAPGLYSRERKTVVPFVFAGSAFFMGGAAFAYFALFPVAFKYFVQFGAPSDVALLTIESYYTTSLKLLVLFGAAFELPVVIVLLGYLGVMDVTFLKKNRQTAVIGIAVVCALFAPPDAISMIILMIPLILMYEGAILVVGWVGARGSKEAKIP